MHVNEIAQREPSKVMVRTVDTDVVIIAIAHFLDIGLQELWIAFGTGKNFRYVQIQKIVATLGPEKSVAISYSGLSYGQNCRRLRNHVWNFYVASARKLAEETVNVTKEI